MRRRVVVVWAAIALILLALVAHMARLRELNRWNATVKRVFPAYGA